MGIWKKKYWAERPFLGVVSELSKTESHIEQVAQFLDKRLMAMYLNNV